MSTALGKESRANSYCKKRKKNTSTYESLDCKKDFYHGQQKKHEVSTVVLLTFHEPMAEDLNYVTQQLLQHCVTACL